MTTAASSRAPQSSILPKGDRGIRPPLPLEFASLIALSRREVVRFIRQPARIAAGLGTPAIIWVVLATGFGKSFSMIASAGTGSGTSTSGVSYAGYLIAGMAAMSAVFTSIFAAMSLIEDRNEGFLQSVLVSPAPGWSIIGAKVIGSSLVAIVQAAMLVAAAPLAGVSLTLTGVLIAAAALVCMCIGVTGIGLALAWKVNSTSGFHGVMNLVLMPMLLLSGAFFPMSGASVGMAWLMKLNPLSWPSETLRGGLLAPDQTTNPLLWLGSAGFALFGLLLAGLLMSRGRDRA